MKQGRKNLLPRTSGKVDFFAGANNLSLTYRNKRVRVHTLYDTHMIVTQSLRDATEEFLTR